MKQLGWKQDVSRSHVGWRDSELEIEEHVRGITRRPGIIHLASSDPQKSPGSSREMFSLLFEGWAQTQTRAKVWSRVWPAQASNWTSILAEFFARLDSGIGTGTSRWYQWATPARTCQLEVTLEVSNSAQLKYLILNQENLVCARP